MSRIATEVEPGSAACHAIEVGARIKASGDECGDVNGCGRSTFRLGAKERPGLPLVQLAKGRFLTGAVRIERRPRIDSSAGDRCLSRRLTPYAQQFAFELRQLMQPLPVAFCTRWGTHVLFVKPRFFDGHVNGRNYATVLANWYFNRPGPTNVIDYP